MWNKNLELTWWHVGVTPRCERVWVLTVQPVFPGTEVALSGLVWRTLLFVRCYAGIAGCLSNSSLNANHKHTKNFYQKIKIKIITNTNKNTQSASESER